MSAGTRPLSVSQADVALKVPTRGKASLIKGYLSKGNLINKHMLNKKLPGP